MVIILYDIPSSTPGSAWSPNVWKVRFCLNYKAIPYKTEWIEYPDIENHLKALGIAPTATKRDGSPQYTVPAIHDPSTGVYMADSLPIAEYLEKHYPDSPSVFPHNTSGLSDPFVDTLGGAVVAIRPFVVPAACQRLNPATHEFYHVTREKAWGKKYEDIAPKGDEAVKQWKVAEEGWGKVADWYSKTEGPFLMGETVSWADFVVGGQLVWYRSAFGEDSKEWEDIMSWQGGHWKAFCEAMKKYEIVN